MSEENSFEIINKKSDAPETSTIDNLKKDTTTTSLVTSVPPPSALPIFVTSPRTEAASASMFHPSSFSPEIPENGSDNKQAITDDNNEEMEDPLEEIGNSIFGWVKDTVSNKGSSLLNKVAEKAKNSMGSVITTLDPQMKDFISNLPDYELIVTSEKEVEVSSIREAFQNSFRRITVRGLEVEHTTLAKQIVGFESANKAALSKIEMIRNQHPVSGPVIAVQSFIAEISSEKWYDLDLLVLQDLEKGMHLETYSQMIPIPVSIINVAKEDTPKNYEHIDTGFSVTASQIMGNNLQVHPSEWQETLTGVSRRERVFSAAKVIANLYKNMLS